MNDLQNYIMENFLTVNDIFKLTDFFSYVIISYTIKYFFRLENEQTPAKYQCFKSSSYDFDWFNIIILKIFKRKIERSFMSQNFSKYNRNNYWQQLTKIAVKNLIAWLFLILYFVSGSICGIYISNTGSNNMLSKRLFIMYLQGVRATHNNILKTST